MALRDFCRQSSKFKTPKLPRTGVRAGVQSGGTEGGQRQDEHLIEPLDKLEISMITIAV